MLREHLGHGDKGLDLHHVLLADVVQFCEMTLADVVNCSKVPKEKDTPKSTIELGKETTDCLPCGVSFHAIFIRIGLLSDTGEVVQEHHHPLLVLQNERIHNLNHYSSASLWQVLPPHTNRSKAGT